jgi:hypothetical protein
MKDDYEKAFPGMFVLGHIIKGDWTLTKNFKMKAKIKKKKVKKCQT